MLNSENTQKSMQNRIAELEQQNAILQKQIQQQSVIAQKMNVVVWTMDINGQFTSVSPIIEKIRGYTEQEVLLQNLQQALTKNSLSDILERLDKFKQQLARGEKPTEPENFHVEQHCKDGSTVWSEIVATPVYKPNGEFNYFLGIGRDTTQQRQAIQNLKDSEEKNKAFSDATDEALFFSDKGICVECNQAASRMFGYSYDELIGLFGTDVIAPEYKEIVKDNMLRGYEKPYKALAQRKDGSTFWAEFHGKMYSYKGNKVRVTAVKNIHEREIALNNEKKSQQFLNAIADNTPTYFAYVTSPDLKYAFVNHNYELAFGQPKHEIMGQHMSAVLGKENFDHAMTYISKAMQGEKSNYEKEFDLEHGLRWMQINYAPDFDATNKVIGLIITAIDITDIKKTRRDLHKAESNYKNLFDNAPIGIIKIDETGKIVQINNELVEILGSPSKKQTMGINIFKFEPLEKAGISQDIETCFASGKTIQNIKAYTTLWGKQSYLRYRIAPVFNDTEELKTVEAIVEDYTELYLIKDNLQKNLEEKSVLLKEIHHRVKNNMQIIISLLKMQTRLLDDEKSVVSIKASINRIYSMALVHENLYKSDSLANINIDNYIKDLVRALQKAYLNKNTIQINQQISSDINLDITIAVPCGLIINELVTNAVKHAFPDDSSGTIHITLDKTESAIRLEISDDGIGIPFDTLEKTNSLGLKIVNVLVDQLDASLEIDNKKGTSIRIKFYEKQKGSNR